MYAPKSGAMAISTNIARLVFQELSWPGVLWKEVFLRLRDPKSCSSVLYRCLFLLLNLLWAIRDLNPWPTQCK